MQVRREQGGSYLCIASNGHPPTVSRRLQLDVKCEWRSKCSTVNVDGMGTASMIVKHLPAKVKNLNYLYENEHIEMMVSTSQSNPKCVCRTRKSEGRREVGSSLSAWWGKLVATNSAILAMFLGQNSNMKTMFSLQVESFPAADITWEFTPERGEVATALDNGLRLFVWLVMLVGGVSRPSCFRYVKEDFILTDYSSNDHTTRSVLSIKQFQKKVGINISGGHDPFLTKYYWNISLGRTMIIL